MRRISGLKIREILKAKNDFSFMTIRDIAEVVDCSNATVVGILKNSIC